MSNIKLILNEKVEKLGEVGEVVTVKPGYARNFLLPRKLASMLTIGAVKRLQKKKELLEKQYQDEKLQTQDIAKKLSELGQIVIFAKAGESGKLFGKVTAKEITEKINAEAGIDINRKQVLLKKSISDVGEHEIKLKLHSEIEAKIIVVVKKEE